MAPETKITSPAGSARTGVGRKLFRIGIVLLLVSLSSFSLAFFHESLQINTGDLSRWARPFLPDLKDQYVFLLLGTDAKIDINRTDTLILVFLDTRKMAIHTMSVLRDTYLEWLQKENRKINAVYAYAWFKERDDRKAVEATRAAVEKLLSIRVDYYVKVDLSAFIRIIDLIGGVDVYVDKNMKYDDFSQNLHINLKKGHQHLDGEKAQQFVRYRRDVDGDRARAQRQQRFMRAVVKQLTRPSVLLRLPDIMRGALKEIVTNVEFDVALALASRFLEGGRPVVDTHVLPGEFDRIGELEYFVHDPRRTEELLKMFLEGTGEAGFAETVEFITERAKIRHSAPRPQPSVETAPALPVEAVPPVTAVGDPAPAPDTPDTPPAPPVESRPDEPVDPATAGSLPDPRNPTPEPEVRPAVQETPQLPAASGDIASPQSGSGNVVLTPELVSVTTVDDPLDPKAGDLQTEPVDPAPAPPADMEDQDSVEPQEDSSRDGDRSLPADDGPAAEEEPVDGEEDLDLGPLPGEESHE